MYEYFTLGRVPERTGTNSQPADLAENTGVGEDLSNDESGNISANLALFIQILDIYIMQARVHGAVE